jgi:5-methyltetrahydrofolate--homocysteine methyltransferase
MVRYKDVKDAIRESKLRKTAELVEAAVNQGTEPSQILNKGLIDGMKTLMEEMETGELLIPEVLRSVKAMNRGVEILKPLLAEEQSHRLKKTVIGTVKGDIHNVGKIIVAMMCRGTGLDVVDLGVDVSPNQFVEALEKHEADLLCLSTLMIPTMPVMEKTIECVNKRGLGDTVKVMVGGLPVTQEYADEFGADAYASNAVGAAKTARRLLN